jgi:hypothetical protein
MWAYTKLLGQNAGRQAGGEGKPKPTLPTPGNPATNQGRRKPNVCRVVHGLGTRIPLIIGGDCAHEPMLNEYIMVAAMNSIAMA